MKVYHIELMQSKVTAGKWEMRIGDINENYGCHDVSDDEIIKIIKNQMNNIKNFGGEFYKFETENSINNKKN